MSGDGHDYIGKHGTQEEQAARQATAGQAEVDGPWRLFRIDANDVPRILPNSVRSTKREALRLQEEEFTRTEVWWDLERFDR